MDNFEIVLSNQLPEINMAELSIYNYNFSDFSLLPLQNIASSLIESQIKDVVVGNMTNSKMVKKIVADDKVEYVAKFSDYTQKKLDSGEWQLGVRKNSGETYAVVKDLKGKIKQSVTLESHQIDNLGNLPELSAIQGQLANLAEQIERLSRQVGRVEQGQYNDRYAGFFTARQLIVEALAVSDKQLQKQLLGSAVVATNTVIGQLMLTLRADALDFVNPKLKQKEAKRLQNLLSQSIFYLNSSVQLNLISYTTLGEEKALISTVANYSSFMNQVLLGKQDSSKHTIAWQIDNYSNLQEKYFENTSLSIVRQITKLLDMTESKRIAEVEDDD